MSHLSQYIEYKSMAIYEPYGFQYFRTLIIDNTLDEILNRQYEHYSHSNSNNYKKYLESCEELEVTPYGKDTYKKAIKRGDIFDKVHFSIHDKIVTQADHMYMNNLPTYEVKRKGFVNQNICLFYKNYFKRKGK